MSVQRTLILGAGASVFAGYPTADGLLDFIQPTDEALETDQNKALLEKIECAMNWFKKHSTAEIGLEQLLTWLELGPPFVDPRACPVGWARTDSLRLSGIIGRTFSGFHEKLQNDVSSRPADYDTIAAGWADRVQAGDEIISFNWDCLHEGMLWEKQKWSYRDGYGFQFPGAAHAPSSKTVFHKLHGAAIWALRSEGDSELKLQRVRWAFPESSNLNWNGFAPDESGGHYLILPTYLKDITRSRILLNAWKRAQTALHDTREVTVIGFSLNPADHPARFLLATELSKNSKLEQITLVSPCGKGVVWWEDFLNPLGKKLLWIEKRFEEWVLD